MKHYLITNRKITKDGSGNEKIHPDGEEPPSDKLRFAEVEVNKKSGKVKSVELLEDIQQPGQVDYDMEAEAEGLKGSARCFRDIYTTMQAEKKDTLFFVHGFNCDLDCALANLTELHKKYIGSGSSIGRIVVFTWPSDGTPYEYRDDAHDAVTSGRALGRGYLKLRKFFEQFFAYDEGSGQHRNEPCYHNLHMMCHSMGNRVLESMVEMIWTKNYNYTRLFKEVILVAADIDNIALEAPRPLHNIVDICDRVHIYFNENDFALTISQTTKNAFNRLGKYGPKNMRKVPNNVNVVDITDTDDIRGGLKRHVIQHAYHYSSPTVQKDILSVLKGEHTEKIKKRVYKPHKNIFRIEH